MVLFDQKIGAEGEAKGELAGTKLQVSFTENTVGAQVSISGALDMAYFLDQGAAKVNSPIVTSIVAIVKGVLASMP